MLLKLVAATVFFLSVTDVALAKTKTIPDQDKMQAACYDDAQRLCGDVMPDVDKTEACMKPKKAQVSAACAAFYK